MGKTESAREEKKERRERGEGERERERERERGKRRMTGQNSKNVRKYNKAGVNKKKRKRMKMMMKKKKKKKKKVSKIQAPVQWLANRNGHFCAKVSVAAACLSVS